MLRRSSRSDKARQALHISSATSRRPGPSAGPFPWSPPGMMQCRERHSSTKAVVMASGILLLRLVMGIVLFAHGAQKLFGWFGGYGLAGTAGFFGGLRFRMPKVAVVIGRRLRGVGPALRRRLPHAARRPADRFDDGRCRRLGAHQERPLRHEQRLRVQPPDLDGRGRRVRDRARPVLARQRARLVATTSRGSGGASASPWSRSPAARSFSPRGIPRRPRRRRRPRRASCPAHGGCERLRLYPALHWAVGLPGLTLKGGLGCCLHANAKLGLAGRSRWCARSRRVCR